MKEIIVNELTRVLKLNVIIFCMCLTLSACDDESTSTTNITESDASTSDAFIPMPVELVPGRSIGPVTIGMSVAELKAALGEPNRAMASAVQAT